MRRCRSQVLQRLSSLNWSDLCTQFFNFLISGPTLLQYSASRESWLLIASGDQGQRCLLKVKQFISVTDRL